MRISYTISLLLSVTSIYLLWVIYAERIAFPVEMQNCSELTNSCFVDSKYQNLQSCQSAAELGNMGCDRKTNPNKIVCTQIAHALAQGVCVIRK
jgi:hypothetical protein